MDSTLILQGIQFSGYCGLTHDERSHPQPIRVDLELDCANSKAGKTDNIQHTVDYAQIINRIMEIGTHKQFYLVESLAEHIIRTLFKDFPILGLKIWVRKTNPPLTARVDSVGVRLIQDRNSQSTQPVDLISQQPSSFLIEQQPQIPKGTVLDVATGHGRNALYLASLGYSVIGIDRDKEALQAIQQKVQDLNLPQISLHAQDLENDSPASLNLGTEAYEGIIVFFYLYRPLFPALLSALKPGGVLVYETFLIDNHRLNHHPRRQEFCLQHNELFQLTPGLRVMHYEEGATLSDPIFTARMVARKE